MAGWGISPNASAKEKIKSEYADTLHGYNSCGIIDWEYYSKLYDIGMDLLDKMYEQGQKDLKESKWISCSERLPECEWGAETKALMYQIKSSEPSKDDIRTGYFGKGGLHRDIYFRRYADATDGVDVSAVVAWMPLPEAYKESED